VKVEIKKEKKVGMVKNLPHQKPGTIASHPSSKLFRMSFGKKLILKEIKGFPRGSLFSRHLTQALDFKDPVCGRIEEGKKELPNFKSKLAPQPNQVKPR
jgi:hypothetical protein